MGLRQGARLQVGEPRRISPPGRRHWFPRLLDLPDGGILQFDCTVDDETGALSQPNGVSGRISRDRGLTWTETSLPPHFGFPSVLPDGCLRSFSYIIWRRADGGLYALSADLPAGATIWTDEVQVPVSIPPVRSAVAGAVDMCFDRTVMALPDGRLIATLYGRLAGQDKYCCLLVDSRDSGRSWRLASTIAYNPAVGTESFCEPVVARVADGSLLAVMRTGSGDQPMYQCRSKDDGHTWRKLESLGVFSVDPDLCLMQSGVLACSFGRPTVNLMLSLDGSGHTWTQPTTIFEGPSTCYTGLREVAPGRLLLVYDSNREGSPWQAADNQINAVFVDVTTE